MALGFSDLLRYNPFKPGAIVSRSMFAGRSQELLELERVLIQTRNGNPAHFMVTGERGIGKSSLFLYLGVLAGGDFEGLSGLKMRFHVVNVDLEKEFTQADILRRLGTELNREIAKAFKIEDFAKGAWSFLRRWDVLGVKYSTDPKLEIKPYELLDELASVIEQTAGRLTVEKFDGILFLIDEADKPSSDAHLGQILKNLTEKLARKQVNNVAFGVAGLPDIITTLRASHESSPRIFKPLILEPLSVPDRRQVIAKGLAEAAQKGGRETKIQPDALELICELSEGYPNFIQQFAYCAFQSDRDYNIDVADVVAGAHGPRGAIEELGTKYFEDLYFDKINSDDYRRVLQVMAEKGDDYATKAEIKKATGLKESTLNNAITILKERKIIRPKDGAKGIYRLPTKSFAAWIRSLSKQSTTTLTQPSV